MHAFCRDIMHHECPIVVMWVADLSGRARGRWLCGREGRVCCLDGSWPACAGRARRRRGHRAGTCGGWSRRPDTRHRCGLRAPPHPHCPEARIPVIRNSTEVTHSPVHLHTHTSPQTPQNTFYNNERIVVYTSSNKEAHYTLKKHQQNVKNTFESNTLVGKNYKYCSNKSCN